MRPRIASAPSPSAPAHITAEAARSSDAAARAAGGRHRGADGPIATRGHPLAGVASGSAAEDEEVEVATVDDCAQ